MQRAVFPFFLLFFSTVFRIRYGPIKHCRSPITTEKYLSITLPPSFLSTNIFLKLTMPDQPYTSDLRRRIAERVTGFVPPRQIFTSPRRRIPPEPVPIPTTLRPPGPNRYDQDSERSQARLQGSQNSGSPPSRGNSPPPDVFVIDLTMSSDEEFNPVPKAPASSPADQSTLATPSRGGTKRAAGQSPELASERGRKAGRGARLVRFADDEDESPRPPGRRRSKANLETYVMRFAIDEGQRSNTPPPAPVRPSRGRGPRGSISRGSLSMPGRRGRPATLGLFETPPVFQSLKIKDYDVFQDSDNESLHSPTAGKKPRLAPAVLRGSRGRRSTTGGRTKTLVPASTRGGKNKDAQELLGWDNEELQDHPVLKPETPPPASPATSEQQDEITDAASVTSDEGYISPLRGLDAVVALARAQAHNAIERATYTEQQKALDSLRDARERRMEEFNKLAKRQAKKRLELRGNRAIDGAAPTSADGGKPDLVWVKGRPYMRSPPPAEKDPKGSR